MWGFCGFMCRIRRAPVMLCLGEVGGVLACVMVLVKHALPGGLACPYGDFRCTWVGSMLGDRCPVVIVSTQGAPLTNAT